MKIIQSACIGCGKCIAYCPMEAIYVEGKKAHINRDECVECGVCYRAGICPMKAFQREELSWPRSIRAVFSDPLNIHKETNMAGRGTSEMKTNDVTGRFPDGVIGVALEVGRPGIGTRIREIQKMTMALAAEHIRFEPCNPFSKFIDPETGKIQEELLDEKVLSAVIEFGIHEKELEDVIHIVERASRELDTVVSVGLAAKARNEAFDYIFDRLEKDHIFFRKNGKLNVGLGRPLKL